MSTITFGSVVQHDASTVEVAEPATVTKKDVLHRAADLLGEFAWCQHEGGSKEEGRFCAAGAIGAAARDLTGSYPEWDAGDWFGFATVQDLHEWNDTAGRTKAEVVARLREAAERA